MRRLIGAGLVLLASACANQPSPPPSIDTGQIIGEVGDPQNRARLHTELAGKYYSIGRMQFALDEARMATSADSNWAPAYGMLGLVYMDLKENKLAQENFEHALKISPNDPDINHNYGWFLCKTDRESESIAYFERAIRNPLYPTRWRSYTAAGICSLRENKVHEAEQFIQQALRLQPNDPGALLQMGQIRYRQGDMEQARRYALRYNQSVPPTAESLWLALRVERRLGDTVAEAGYANQLRRDFPRSPEYQLLQRGAYD
ncbi:MAG TPA: type IV pilus biogenesis/stability protein PilW [Burkholderiales bacterium]|nr:type IV pilus biogenesis/stability protein PilW [Burkholderiales bacterium]